MTSHSFGTQSSLGSMIAQVQDMALHVLRGMIGTTVQTKWGRFEFSSFWDPVWATRAKLHLPGDSGEVCADVTVLRTGVLAC